MELFNEEYEKSLLGALFRNPDLIDKGGISEALFFRDKSRKIYQAIRAVNTRMGAVDLKTVVKETGPKFAADVAEITGFVGNYEFYQKELTELYNKRSLYLAARECLESIDNKAKGADEILGELESSLLDIDLIRDRGYQKMSGIITGVINEIEEAIGGNGGKGVVMTGIEDLDKLIDGFRPEEYIIIGARPGTGKTSIALNMTLAAVRARKKVGFFSAEMSRNLITKRMLCSMAGVNGQRVRSGVLSKEDMEKLMMAAQEMYTSQIFVNDSPNIKIGTLISEARRMRRKESIDILFVDYMSLITTDNPNIPRHEQVSDLSRRFKQLARELEIPVVVIVQVNREAQDKRPSMANLRESGSLEQDSDIIMLMWNRGWAEDSSQMIKVTMIVEKNRNGATGDVDLMFKPDITRFYPQIHKNIS